MARAVEASHDVNDPGAATVVQVAVGESHTLALTGAVQFHVFLSDSENKRAYSERRCTVSTPSRSLCTLLQAKRRF